MNIQWYPGHMTKTRRMLEENIKLVDAVIEICDARIPLASRNDSISDVFTNKPRLIILNKADLADKYATDKWIRYYKSKSINAIGISAVSQKDALRACQAVIELVKDKIDARKEKGINMTVRAMIVGIPNSGKSTFTNTVGGSARAKTGDQPGVTRGKQWIKAAKYLELLDTPGILPPKIANEQDGLFLAYTGAVRDDIMDSDSLIIKFLADINKIAPNAIKSRYNVEVDDCDSEELIERICRKRGWLLSGGVIDSDRASRVILDEFRSGKLGHITLQSLPEETKDNE